MFLAVSESDLGGSRTVSGIMKHCIPVFAEIDSRGTIFSPQRFTFRFASAIAPDEVTGGGGGKTQPFF